MDTSNIIKTKMMKLWKDIFHDSDAYISLIFDNYFDINFIEYHEEKNQIVSALLGIPYTFSNGEHSIKGLYLCGLATKEEYRQRGIMRNLINKINNKAKAQGYVLSFLIPASDSLRIYYQSKGYVNAIYRIEDRYTCIHDFDKDGRMEINREDDKIKKYRQKYYSEITIEIIENFDELLLKNITDYIQFNEKKKREYMTLQHSEKNIRILLNENRISNGKILIAKDKSNNIIGIVFITANNRGEIIIPKIYYENSGAFYKLLDRSKHLFPESSMGLWKYPEESDRKLIWEQNYIPGSQDGINTTSYGSAERVYDTNMHSNPYGMIKILNLYEILKFMAEDNHNLKFSILVKQETSSPIGNYYKVDSGKIDFKENVEESLIKQIKHNSNFSILTERDLSEIIFRKKDSNNLIMEAFGLPRLALNMSLMLD